ncbi:hypothetical protein GOHSU_02_00520 [Gordonia hirsuta DSM 44140 = NBRC 16056]|uniref:Mce-associated membrane protein n=1 Tax=Gordonia hirsuta DSM 44140 = NBRC 16056 TaxID=1121927 RepID=L7L4N5_9ACTN|nr:hypothetical protein [Gordonia hirsuta]GAC55909.1 hypothetical protein GOHSU_02_00520 [Gordonia hirsuta DSM 44140 = NBRC 16056]
MSSDSTSPDTPADDNPDATDQTDPIDAADVAVSSAAADTKQPAGEKSGVAAKAARRAKAAGTSDDGDSTSGDSTSGKEFTVSARSLWRSLMAALVVVALVAIGVLGWKTWSTSRTLDAFDETKSFSRSFVQTYFETMMSSDTTAEKIQAKVLPMTTGEARDRVKEEAEVTVKMVTEGQFKNMTVDVNAVMVESFTATTATTVVAATLAGTSALQTGGGQQAFLLDLHLVKEDGQWLVGKMTPTVGSGGTAGETGSAVPGAPGEQTEPSPAEPAPGG